LETSVILCPYNGWVDEIELCKLWNQVQSLSTTVDTLISLVNALLLGKRSKRSLSLPGNYQNMTTTEQETLVALIDAYNAIFPCCFPATDCNELVIDEVSARISSLNTQLEAAGTLSQAFIAEYSTYTGQITELDETCGRTPSTTVSTETTATTVTTTVTTTESVCCPEYSSLEPEVCALLCALVFGRRRRSELSIDSAVSTESSTVAMEEAYILLFTRLRCIRQGKYFKDLNIVLRFQIKLLTTGLPQRMRLQR